MKGDPLENNNSSHNSNTILAVDNNKSSSYIPKYFPLSLINCKCIPLAYGTKDKPLCKWSDPTTHLTVRQAEELMNKGLNTAILLSEESNLCCVDVDNEEMMPLIDGLCNGLKTTSIKTGKGTHYYFRWADFNKNSKLFTNKCLLYNKDNKDLGDIRTPGSNFYQLAPGSKHPNGNIYTVKDDVPLKNIDNKLVAVVLNKIKNQFGIIAKWTNKSKKADTDNEKIITEDDIDAQIAKATATPSVKNTNTPNLVRDPELKSNSKKPALWKNAPDFRFILKPGVADDGTQPTVYGNEIKGANPFTGCKDGYNFSVGIDVWHDWHNDIGDNNPLVAIALANGIITYKEVLQAKINDKKIELKGKKYLDTINASQQYSEDFHKDLMDSYNQFIKNAEEIKESAKPKGKKSNKKEEPKKEEIEIEVFSPEIIDKAKKIWESGKTINHILKSCADSHVGDEHIFSMLALQTAGLFINNFNGISLYITGTAGTGKSDIKAVWTERLPNETYLDRSLSDKALFYMAKEGILHPSMTIFLDDHGLSDEMSNLIKNITSNYKRGTIHSTVGGSSAKREHQELIIPPYVAVTMVSADMKGDEQIADRMIVLQTTDTDDQKKNIRNIQIKKAMGIIDEIEIEQNKTICRCIWNMFMPKSVDVVIPFLNLFNEGETLMNPRARGDFINIIMSITLLNAFKRRYDVVKNKIGEEIRKYYSTPDDFYTAVNIIQPLLKDEGGSQQHKLSSEEKLICDILNHATYNEDNTIGELSSNTQFVTSATEIINYAKIRHLKIPAYNQISMAFNGRNSNGADSGLLHKNCGISKDSRSKILKDHHDNEDRPPETKGSVSKICFVIDKTTFSNWYRRIPILTLSNLANYDVNSYGQFID